ncbi:MAG: outer membrane protein transport protein [Gammaproteobacteria bacterium]
MHKTFKRSLLALSVMGALAASGTAYATNGYFSNAYSTSNLGLAGAGVAMPEDAMAASMNPAGMVDVGSQFDLSVGLFAPNRKYSTTGSPIPADAITGCGAACPVVLGGGATGNQSITSKTEQGDISGVFIIPGLGFNQMIGNDQAIGVSMYGNGGMNTKYKGGQATMPDGAGNAVLLPGTFGAGTTGVDLSQLFLNVSYSQKPTNNFSWGVSLIYAYQLFDAYGLGNFAGYSAHPQYVSNNGYDNSSGFGVNVGILYDFGPATLGVMYQPQITMSKFSQYKGLFADGGSFDIPATYAIGATFKNVGPGKLTAEVQQIDYSQVKALKNGVGPLLTSCTAGATGGTGSGCLGASNGAGFGWSDMTIYKIGYQWATSANWTWRVGYSHGNDPVPGGQDVLFNILAPGTIEDHLTFGFSKKLSPTSGFNFAAMYAPESKKSGTNPFSGNVQKVTVKMDQFQLQGGYTMRF